MLLGELVEQDFDGDGDGDGVEAEGVEGIFGNRSNNNWRDEGGGAVERLTLREYRVDTALEDRAGDVGAAPDVRILRK